MTRIVHCKKEKYNIYIGRPSKWGNPFSHKSGTLAKFKVNTVKEALEAYEQWITKGEGKHLLNDLHELRGKVLGCWCGNFTMLDDQKELKCHGQILLRLIADHLIIKDVIKTLDQKKAKVKLCPNCKEPWNGFECHHCAFDPGGFDPNWD